MAREYRDLNARLAELEKTAMAAEQGFREGNLDADSYVGLQSNYLEERVAALRLSASLDKAQAALDTLLGLPPCSLREARP